MRSPRLRRVNLADRRATERDAAAQRTARRRVYRRQLFLEELEARRLLADNLAPENSVPEEDQATQVDTPLAFTDFRGNRISTSDPDAGVEEVKVTLAA